MNEIIELMTNGNWADAKELYLELDITPNEFRQYLENSDLSKETLVGICMLGFYIKF